MRTKPRKVLIDRLLGDWWVDVGIALALIVTVTLVHFLDR